jgi:hypothetical protein
MTTLLAMLATGVALYGATGSAHAQAQQFAVTQLSAGMHLIKAEVAATEA